MNYISKYLPFSYLWIFNNAIDKSVKTVLDVGCGDGNFMKDLATAEHWKITGIDIYPKSLEKAQKTGVYTKLIKGDVLKVVQGMIIKKQKFDLVFCSATLEHLPKRKALSLLKLVDKLAKKTVIFGTPNGFINNPKEFLEENSHQEHKSGWTKDEFISFGYKVYGAGLKLAWAEDGPARSKNLLVSALSRFFSFAFSPVFYFFPSLSAAIIAVRDIKK
jgi:ubiquinone/menaquinone biosynthesis C-methylase UbiE